jgi:SAM-dependent methyltransferase
MLKTWLTHPLTRGLHVDDPSTTLLRRHIIQEKSFLRQIYQEWYLGIAEALPAGKEPVLEIGAGAGFFSDFIPGLITSDLFYYPGITAVMDGQHLPFANDTLCGVVMTDVLHHLPCPRRFLIEAARCVRPGGAIVMVEPWVTPWSSAVYGRLHPEPFQPQAVEWEFPPSGPLSGSNGALPWMMFKRDRARFEKEFTEWHIEHIRPLMPFRYLLSGGLSSRSLMPGRAFRFWRALEHALQPWMDSLAMFAQIVLRRTDGG